MQSVFSKETTPMSDYVVLQSLDKTNTFCHNGIILSNRTCYNGRLGLYKIISAGENATRMYGVNNGMLVYVDKLACTGKDEKYPVVKYNSIICELDEDTHSLKALKGMTITKRINTDKYVDIDGIIDKSKKDIPLGKVLSTTSDEIKINDIIVLTAGADNIDAADGMYYIYKNDMIRAKYN